MKALIVVDMQNDFIDGKLGSKEARAIVDKVRQKIEERKAQGYEIIYTRDTHHEDYLNTNEGKHLPVEHCIYNSMGWQIYDGLLTSGAIIIDKPNFGYIGWDNYAFSEVELIGVCTDICVISNAIIIKAMHPNIKITVDSSCCAGTSIESHNAALIAMKMCQIDII